MNTLTVNAPASSVSIPIAAARASVICAGVFLAALAAVHLLTPDLDPSRHPISEYALGRRGWVMTLAFVAWGASAASLAVALSPHVRTRAGRIGLAFLCIGAAGPLLAAAFPTDPIDTATAAATASGTIHNVAASLSDGIPVAALILTVSLLRRSPGWRAVRWPLIAATTAAWVGVVVMTALLALHMAATGGELGPNVAVGWPARAMIGAYVAWIALAARHAGRLQPTAE